MRKAHLIYAEMHTNKDEFCQLLSEQFNLKLISISELVRTEIELQSELGINIKTHFENESKLPNKVTEILIRNKVESNLYDILFVDYPRTEIQYESFKEQLKDMNIRVEHIWYLRLQNLEFTYEQLNTKYLSKYNMNFNDWNGLYKKHQSKINKIINYSNLDITPTIVSIDLQRITDLQNFFKMQIKNSA